MLYILGSSLVLVDSSCNKDSGWRQLAIHVEHLRGISTARNKYFTRVPMDCTATRRKSFMSRSCPCCLGMNVLLSIKILTPFRILLVVISTRPGGWCCPGKPWVMRLNEGGGFTAMQYLPISLQAACQSRRDVESMLWTLTLVSQLNEKYWVDRAVKYIKNKFFVSSSTSVASSPYLGPWMQINSYPAPD